MKYIYTTISGFLKKVIPFSGLFFVYFENSFYLSDIQYFQSHNIFQQFQISDLYFTCFRFTFASTQVETRLSKPFDYPEFPVSGFPLNQFKAKKEPVSAGSFGKQGVGKFI